MPSSRSPRVALLLAALLLAAGLAASATRLNFTASNASANETTWMKGFDSPAMALADFDGDGRAEIVAQNENRVAYVFSSTGPTVLAELKPPYPSGWGARALNDVAVADLDRDGRLDVVLVTSAALVCDYEYAGKSSTGAFQFTRNWCTRLDRYDGGAASSDSGAWVEDVNGDGRKELFAQTEQKGLFALNADGSIRWSKDEWGGNAGPVVADLEGDGKKDALFFSDGGRVRAFDASSGASKWSFHASAHVSPASIPVAGSVADLDGDGRREVVFIARDARDTTNYANNHFALFVLNAWGGLKWKAQPSWGNPLSYTHPILADVDGDGKKEIIAQDWNTIGHKPGNWERLGPAHVFAYSHTGALKWMTSLDNPWSNEDVALADPDGDGRLEVMAIGPSSGVQGVWYLNARTGAKESWVSASGWTPMRGFLLGDFHGNGKLAWAMSVDGGARGGALQVFATDAACRVVYGGWQNANPCSPLRASGGTAPPPAGNFSATFSNVKGNTWWVEASVTASKPLAGVDARVDGGSWVALDLKSWGAWAKSFHVPTGAMVELRARATTGDSVTSAAHAWPPS